MNCTEPVGAPVAPSEVLVTVAVKVTACPKIEGFEDDATAVEVLACETLSVAVAVFPEPALPADTAPEVLTSEPADVPVTLTTTVQLLFTAIVPAVKLTLELPATAVAVPPQPFVSPLGVATTIPAGSVSVNATPVSAKVLADGLVRVKVRVEFPFRGTVVGLNAFAIVGGKATVRLAEAVFPVPPLVELTAPELLMYAPDVELVIVTTTVQEVFTPMSPPLKEMRDPPAVAEAVPPQLFVSPLGVATTNPKGSESLKATPNS
jgi:hypothetical protein